MKRQLTAEQTAKRDARRLKFRELWKQVAAMPEEQRVSLSLKYGFIKAKDGGTFSPCNMMLIAMQCPQASALAGFRDWLKLGRAVRKGEHGISIWVPIGHKTTEVKADGTETTDIDKAGFIGGTIFDISQTDEITAPVAVVSPEVAEAFNMGNLPNVRVAVEEREAA